MFSFFGSFLARVGERNAEGHGNNAEGHGKSMMTDKLINALHEWNLFQCFPLVSVIFSDNEDN